MVTARDVAKRAGVSQATVSYVMSGSRPISEATKKRVRKAMDELGYVPNINARSLAGGKSVSSVCWCIWMRIPIWPSFARSWW